jgi:aminotransferase
MARDVGVAAVPGSSFFHEPIRHLIRLHFAKRSETLAAAGERLLKLKKKAELASLSIRSEAKIL